MDFALFETIKGFSHLTGDSKLDDDFVDRLNRYWTALILVMFAIVLSAKQIVGEPLKCWTPPEFKPPWIQYAEDFCWVKNTYFVPHDKELGENPAMRKQEEIGYYQWIPYVLTLQAFCYYLPAMVWRMFNWKCGLDLSSIVSRAAKQDNLNGIGFQLGSNFVGRMDSHLRGFFCQRDFLTCLYLLTKVLYSVNSVGQFLVLSAFFGRATDALFNITRDLSLGVEWHKSGHFPRVTFCDFSVRGFGNINSYSIQCVLAINIFTEKIFVFAGFWMLLVAIVTVVHSLGWLVSLVLPWRRSTFIERLAAHEMSRVDRYELEEFQSQCLGNDGLLVFHLIASNSDERTAGKLMARVWNEYNKHLERLRRGSNPSNDSPTSEMPMSSEAGDSSTEAGTLLLKSREAGLPV